MGAMPLNPARGLAADAACTAAATKSHTCMAHLSPVTGEVTTARG
jgi:hypothetical protein